MNRKLTDDINLSMIRGMPVIYPPAGSFAKERTLSEFHSSSYYADFICVVLLYEDKIKWRDIDISVNNFLWFSIQNKRQPFD